MKTRKLILKKLQKDLSQFGLNPMDWKIRQKSKTEVLIHHKVDQTFQLLGSLCLQSTKPKIQEVSLISI